MEKRGVLGATPLPEPKKPAPSVEPKPVDKDQAQDDLSVK
jgi:hypothetical protein